MTTSRRGCWRAPIALLILTSVLVGCGAANANKQSEPLRPEEIRPALKDLPFRIALHKIQPPKDDSGAFRGTAHGHFGSTINFSIGVGTWAVPIAGTTVHATYDEEAGFAFNDDTAIGSRFKTVAQWHEASRMAVAMEERLCRKATGEPCPP